MGQRFWTIIVLALAPSGGLGQQQPLDCGFVDDEVDCATVASGTCECVAGSCDDPTRYPYSRPITFTASASPCAKVISNKTGPCWARFECLNSAGTDEGSCADPYQPTCYHGSNLLNFETQQYKQEGGLCMPGGCKK